MKEEHDPIFPAGFHNLTVADLERTFLDPFPNSPQRKYLVERFKAFWSQLILLEIPFEVWLDGSFSTQKPDPQDIDLLIVMSQVDLNSLPPDKHIFLQQITKNKDVIKIRYGCDAYICLSEDQNTRSYWRGWFGYTRTEIVKGIPKLTHVIN